jgi:UDP-N-acetylglucosamine/UDP-N-acetylgalactosamine diphosphorylase
LLDGVSFGSGAHVRGGTLLEENSSCAHSVGLKQTMLMPFVTLGSLINFCDCLMTGGTGSKDHSEVGSSYIHFNFTAHQDKATPSIAGNVPEGIMLDNPPIFLGGQAGLVGPTRLAFGTIIAAGTICRRDVLETGKLVFGQIGRGIKETNYDFNTYGDITRILNNNLIYIGNLHALYAWYQHIRPLMMADDIYTQACINGAKTQIEAMVEERIKRLGQLADKVSKSLEITESIEANDIFVNQWPDMKEKLALPVECKDDSELSSLIKIIGETKTTNYIETIKSLSPKAKQQCTNWLEKKAGEKG